MKLLLQPSILAVGSIIAHARDVTLFNFPNRKPQLLRIENKLMSLITSKVSSHKKLLYCIVQPAGCNYGLSNDKHARPLLLVKCLNLSAMQNAILNYLLTTVSLRTFYFKYDCFSSLYAVSLLISPLRRLIRTRCVLSAVRFDIYGVGQC